MATLSSILNLHFKLSLTILFHFIIITISQENYFIHTFEDANEGFIDLAYPNAHCTLIANHFYAEYYWFDCIANGDAFYCNNNADDTCQASGQCVPGPGTVSYDPNSVTPNSLHYGECPLGLFNINTNYAQIELYTSANPTNDGCPSSVDFNAHGTIKIATNICVLQSDATYLMMSCDGLQAQINVYNDNTCTQYNATLLQYSRICNYYTGGGANKMYHRLEGCYINNQNQLQPTPTPTANPSTNPTISPSLNPSISPTFNPSISPTESPTIEPTIYPTYYPSIPPTKQPTIIPTLSPTVSSIDKIPHTASIISDFDNITLLYIIFVVLIILYMFICFYIWCNERRNRSNLTFNFQRENEIDKKERMEYLAANGIDADYYNGHVEVDPAAVNHVELQQFDRANNVVLLDEDEHRQALINEGFMD